MKFASVMVVGDGMERVRTGFHNHVIVGGRQLGDVPFSLFAHSDLTNRAASDIAHGGVTSAVAVFRNCLNCSALKPFRRAHADGPPAAR